MKRILCPKCDNYITFDETKYSEGQSLVFICEHCKKQFSIRIGKTKLKATRKEEVLDEQANSQDYGSIVVVVEVADTSGNKTSATYYISVDNSVPVINGVENYKVYDSALQITAKDTRGNLLQVEVYKGENLINEFVADLGTDTFNMELTEVGKYIVIATDTYGNETRYIFEIKEFGKQKLKQTKKCRTPISVILLTEYHAKL